MLSSWKVLKITWGFRARLQKNEQKARAAQGVAYTPLLPRGGFYNNLISCRYFCLSCAKTLPKKPPPEESSIYVEKLVQQHSFQSTEEIHWKRTINSDCLEIFWNALQKDKARYEIEILLDHVYLPETGAHGDFCENQIMQDQYEEIRVIDWECWNSKGSFVNDILRFFSFRAHKEHCRSQFDPFLLLEHDWPYAPLERYLTLRQASLLAAINNVCVVSRFDRVAGRASSLEYFLPSFLDVEMGSTP